MPLPQYIGSPETVNFHFESTYKYFHLSQGTYLSTETAEKRIPKVAQSEGKVLVEKVTQKLAHSVVAPPASQRSSFKIS